MCLRSEATFTNALLFHALSKLTEGAMASVFAWIAIFALVMWAAELWLSHRYKKDGE